MKIYKYTLPSLNFGRFSLDLPQNAKILTVQVQEERPQIWALVSPDNPAETREFLLAGTGRELEEKEENLRYIGTVQEYEGEYIYHLFEIIRGS